MHHPRELRVAMTDVKLSVLVPTNRTGGLDILFDSLRHQTFKEFELILVDAIYERRRHVVAERIGEYPFRVVHLPPWGNAFPRANYCRSLNVGLAHCRGDIVVYQCDYSWLHADCLAEHAAFHSRHPGSGLMLDYRYCALPQVSPLFPKYGPAVIGVTHAADPRAYDRIQDEAADAYAADLAAGRLDGTLWSLFRDRPTGADVLALPLTLTHSKNACEAPQDPSFCSLKNESIPLKLLVDANGHDEEFDSSHGWQDSEICHRLIHRHGMTWWSNGGKGLVTVVDARPIFYFRKQDKPTGWNGQLMVRKTINAELPVNPGYALREIRRWVCPEVVA